MKIKEISIKRYRSILNLTLEIDDIDKISTICGANNVGKTNVLRAIDTFFNPLNYIADKDSPHHKFYGTRGAKVYPEIELKFIDQNHQFEIKRIFDIEGLNETKGEKTEISTGTKTTLSDQEIESLLIKTPFFFIPSINISTPELINNLIDDLYDIEYEKSRFRGLKSQLKSSFETYINGVVEILNNLAEEINPLFNQFNKNWEVGFEFVSDVKKFRDLISNDIDFFLNDKSNRHIDAKGSGLQRLGFILLHSRIISKISRKNPILLIDEPDVYIHQGLQKKLHQHLVELSSKCQIIITSHSPVFIDTYALDNVFLLDLEIGEKQTYQRTGKEFHTLKTVKINLEDDDGFKKIREYLGIELDDYDLLDNYNIMVEGDSDLRYISESASLFGIRTPNIIRTHGVTKYEKHLDFYNSFYKDKPIKPKIRVIFDNDIAGRDEFKKIYKKVVKGHYSHIEITCDFIPNCEGEKSSIQDILDDKVNCNIEIEDFIYPQIFVHLANQILSIRSFNKVLWSEVKEKIKAPAFKDKGILYNFDLVKNEKNPQDGHTIDFTSNQIKEGIAGRFRIEGNKGLARKIKNYDTMYPEVKKYLEEICKIF